MKGQALKIAGMLEFLSKDAPNVHVALVTTMCYCNLKTRQNIGNAKNITKVESDSDFEMLTVGCISSK